jgi:hypothetical protein
MKALDLKKGSQRQVICIINIICKKLKYNSGIDFGPLGQEYCPIINSETVFGEDGKSWTFEANLLPNQHYQVLIDNSFRKDNGSRLKPYLIDFKTAD